MNALVTQKTQLPAHLAHLANHTALMGVNAAGAAGVSSGGWPRIGIKAARFRLQHPQGEEVVHNALDLDVIVVDANPHGLSKTFYLGKYDPNGEDKGPDCYSDNGVGPSARASKPQASNCATCPHNIWGSKINDNGTSSKACNDSKKVAVLIADNPDGPVFELRVPPASLKNWANYIESLNNRGIPAAAIVTKLTFDSSADYPKLLFTASGWANEAQVAAVMEVIGTEEVDQCTGKNDKPVAGNVAIAAPGTVPVREALPPLPMAPPMMAAPALPPMPPVAASSLPPMPVAPGMPMPPVAAEAPAAPAKRTRKPKAETFTPAAPAPLDNAPLPPFLVGGQQQAAPLAPMPPLPPSAAAVAAPLSAPVTNSALDDLIAQAMKV